MGPQQGYTCLKSSDILTTFTEYFLIIIQNLTCMCVYVSRASTSLSYTYFGPWKKNRPHYMELRSDGDCILMICAISFTEQQISNMS